MTPLYQNIVYGWVDGGMGKWMWMDWWMDGWVGGWMDGGAWIGG